MDTLTPEDVLQDLSDCIPANPYHYIFILHMSSDINDSIWSAQLDLILFFTEPSIPDTFLLLTVKVTLQEPFEFLRAGEVYFLLFVVWY